ncbi:MAG: HAD family hydrolase [Actinobacteria bacterium]|nr:HAD family hydrolase [Actinomycetota bacterium]
MLRAVTFDFWSTLFVDTRGKEREELRAAVLRDTLSTAGLPVTPQALTESLSASWGHFDTVWLNEHRTPPCSELVDAILASLGVRLPRELSDPLVDRFERLVLEIPPEPMPGAVYTMPQLAERYRLAIICDTGFSPGSVLRQLLDKHDLLGYFEYTYFSNEHGISKPDTRVFIHVLEELGVRPPEAAHVGDIQRTDIAGAQAAGMSAVHFVGVNNKDLPHSTGDVVVSHFEELPRALGSLICAGC